MPRKKQTETKETVGDILEQTAKPAESKGELKPLSAESATVYSMIEKALHSDVSLDRLERLIEMKERMEKKQAEYDFDQAMARAQEEMRPVLANKKNTQTNSKYATYAAIDKVI